MPEERYPMNPYAKTTWITIEREDIEQALSCNVITRDYGICPLTIAIRRYDPAGYVRYGLISGEFAVFYRCEWCAPPEIVPWLNAWFHGKEVTPIAFCFTEF